jgi:hypothetical protein
MYADDRLQPGSAAGLEFDLKMRAAAAIRVKDRLIDRINKIDKIRLKSEPLLNHVNHVNPVY